MGLLMRWLISALTLIIVANVIEGVQISGLSSALIAILVLGIANAVIRPILLILTLPINIITLGLFTFVINAIILYMVASVVTGFEISGFLDAVIGTILLSLMGSLVNMLVK